ncbi:D-alanyl-D-alanine carboxypeptidase/D-alanyl-D-alanine endopeptidase [Fluoribacter gormanii]|uniref:D-alanyl-D-alanine carboxypeptidase n=1 Tax=Fluoribacter gormanii TaxID=464 RepID=A0A377GKD4_9GAMM|nr:D-alanyl-D-alanine carboxypeptidase/D-alanyl-D-alanine-endopeptidase [Fluoribacter gormanii]KTD00956.1 D-Ala-D-Ala carboxypeptidase [Fluoribacter gormanii]SIQ83612.1 D-alanyl-D-alanine carboxypeptidase / D-alanyl-D-alanine-endopeptidase (penicillin-binding protein 4) [Fluoribacter gormanii]STO25074.1 D-alanyl-D-alanine carboxypeptidase precursor [Fluoribacter gormanii]
MQIKQKTIKIFFNTITSLFIFLSSTSSNANQSLPKEVLNVMHQPRYQNAQWWIEVNDLNTQETIYQLNANHLLMPASVTKLFSSAAALNVLGYDYRFKTPVYFIGQQVNNTLNGNLILVGKGDLELGGRVHDDKLSYGYIDHIYANDLPGAAITPENPLNGLISLAKQIKAKGIKQINGDVLVDNRLFKTAYVRNYTISPIMINENLFDFQIKPTTVGQKASIKWRPQAPGYYIDNQVVTVGDGEKTDIETSTSNDDTRLTIKGQIAANAGEVLRVAPISKPAPFARQAFIAALKQQGIVVQFDNKNSQLPDADIYNRLSPIAQYISPPFSEYVKIILKLSHNIGADLLPLLLAQHNNETSFAQGLPHIAKFLIDTVGLTKNEFVFGDGAGGDTNRLLPKAAIGLLTYMHKLPESQFKLFYDALPILGVDGSLAKAAQNIPAVGKIHGKTGTSISYDFANQRFYSFSEALSGYIEAKNGHLLVFIIAVSNTPMETIDDAFQIQKDVSKVAAGIYNNS